MDALLCCGQSDTFPVPTFPHYLKGVTLAKPPCKCSSRATRRQGLQKGFERQKHCWAVGCFVHTAGEGTGHDKIASREISINIHSDHSGPGLPVGDRAGNGV